jgi:glutamate-1-semialdehyde 2,1-aminomutase
LVPDAILIGRSIGAGLPFAAVAGSKAMLRADAHDAQASEDEWTTPSSLSVAAVMATLDLLEADGAIEQLDMVAAQLAQGLSDRAKSAGVALVIGSVGSIVSIRFPREDGSTLDDARHQSFASSLLELGVVIPSDPTEPMFVSLAHTSEDIDDVLTASSGAFKGLAKL